MKRDKVRKTAPDTRMEIAGGDPSELNDINEESDLAQIRKDVAKLHDETVKKQQPLYTDKVMTQLLKDVVFLNDFSEFPTVSVNANQG